MEKYTGSITVAGEIALWRKHIYADQQAGQEMMFALQGKHHTCRWRLAADQIISLVSLKLVAAKVKGGEAVVKSMSTAMSSIIDGVFNPSEPGDDTPTNIPPWFVHWPGPPPGPYLVAAELTQYSNLLTDESAKLAFGEIINTFAVKITSATAGH
jgi:hypothetical protein